MKQFRFVPLALVAVLAACASDLPTGSPQPETPAFSKSASNAALVSGSFVVGGGAGVVRHSGPSNNGQGTCEEGGKYRNHGGNLAQNWPHTQCITEGAAVTVSFAAGATYVVAPSGNVNLNFGPDTFVHYQANQNRTRAEGTLFGSGSDGSSWTVALAQLAGPGNAFSGSSVYVQACPVGGGACHGFTLSW